MTNKTVISTGPITPYKWTNEKREELKRVLDKLKEEEKIKKQNPS